MRLKLLRNPLFDISPLTRKRYGPVYRVSLGFWQFKVASFGDVISSVLAASPELLCNDITHRETFYVVSGARASFSRLHKVMIRELFPLVDKTLSPRPLGQTTHAFGRILLSQINNFIREHTGPISLAEFTNQPLYNATNLILLGSAFPSDTYRDFRTVSQSIPYRFTRTLLWAWPSHAARARLLNTLKGYLQRGEVIGCDDRFSLGFMETFKDNNIQSWEGAQLVLNFLWGVHNNTLSNSLFLLSFLLGDPSALARVRAEIDSAVEKFGSLETLLEAGPDQLDDPSFQLLTSAIMETLRFTVLHAGIRQANCDFELRVKDRVIPIKKGEYVFGNVHAAHMDATVYPKPETFVVDRFAQRPYQRRHLQTGGYPFHSFGGGRHIVSTFLAFRPLRGAHDHAVQGKMACNIRDQGSHDHITLLVRLSSCREGYCVLVPASSTSTQHRRCTYRRRHLCEVDSASGGRTLKGGI